MNDWPVCVCDACIACGCNAPWNHHHLRSECILLPSFDSMIAALINVAVIYALTRPDTSTRTVDMITAVTKHLYEIVEKNKEGE